MRADDEAAPTQPKGPAGAVRAELEPASADDGGPVRGDDGLLRTPWAYGSPELLAYYDEEWGMPAAGERDLFERISLEGFQAGLSWLTILRKRNRFREVFAGFDPDAVAAFGEADVARLLADPGIIRHRGKIEATIGNARAVVALRKSRGVGALIEEFAPSVTPAPRTVAEVPTQSAESRALSKELKRRGFRFVGPTTVYALFEALGYVDTHLVGSHRRGCSGRWGPDGQRIP